MRYVLTEWTHNFSEEPFQIYSEIDSENWEIKKLELYKSGKIGFAFGNIESNGSFLAEVQYPPIDEINKSDQIYAKEIKPEEFYKVWNSKVVV